MSESIEATLARHRKEAKELQSKITQKKKQATKKTRKGVNDECTRLEEDLKQKQAAQLAALSGDIQNEAEPISGSEPDEDVGSVADKLQEVTISRETKEEDKEDGSAQKGPKRNRQKERLARRAAEQEEAAKKAEAEALLQPNWKKQERTALEATFRTHNLSEVEIRPDGHCLYSAIADQLTHLNISLGAQSPAENTETLRYKPVRRRAAMYILDHADEFEPFMEEPLISYVSKIERTAEWGGHLELVALAKSYNVEINVIQDGKVDRIEPGDGEGASAGGGGRDSAGASGERERKKIWLAYYHHGYGLGEHYNSLRPAQPAGEKGEKTEMAEKEEEETGTELGA